MIGLINQSDGNFGNPDATFAEEEMEENLSFNTIADIADANSIKELLRSWATNNGEKVYSKKVINILLIGEDDEDGSHRSDSTMLVSVISSNSQGPPDILSHCQSLPIHHQFLWPDPAASQF